AVIDNLMALWKNSQERIFELASGKADKQLTDLLTARKDESVLIDVAGLFRDLKPTEIAEKILECRPNAKGVLLYDDEGRELVYEAKTKKLTPRENSVLDLEDLFIFIRKSKAIGTDIEGLSTTAQAIVTADKDTYRDLLIQGTGRMRLLTEGQIAGYAIPQE